MRKFLASKSWLSSVGYAPNGRFIATGGSDSTVKIWNIEGGDLIGEFRTESAVLSIAISPDSKKILYGTSTKAALIDLNGNSLVEYSGGGTWVNGVAFSPDGRWVATGGKENSAKIWSINGNLMQELAGHTQQLFSLQFSPNGKFLLTGAEDGKAIVWDVSGKLLKEIKGHNSWIRNVAFSPAGNLVATGSGDNTVILWEISFK
ncbi:MAG: WD40 repeat domain-containing protein [Bacteroidota bacterium]